MSQFNAVEAVEQIRSVRKRILAELRKAIVGQDEVIDHLLITLLARGHCLLTGVPGLGKTLLVKSVARTLSLSFKRIQFTPDLMPADIFGTEVIEEDLSTGKRHFRFVAGPIFANIILADEINRTPPKTQAALLEAMEERQVTAGGHTHVLELPFFVLATQNPIELEGTYPLPEAQLDRFLLNSVMTYLPTEDEIAMITRTTSPESSLPEEVLHGADIERLQKLVREVPVSEHVASYTVRLVSSSRATEADAPAWIKESVKWGAGSRASQALLLAGKAKALLEGRYTVAIEDVQALARPALRHRIIPNFRAEAEGITSDEIIEQLLEKVGE